MMIKQLPVSDHSKYKMQETNTYPCVKVKAKAVPQHTYGGAGGERRYSSYSFTTSALDGSGQRHAPSALYPRGKDPCYPLDRRLGGPQSRSGHGLEEKSLESAGDRTSIAQSFSQ
jgi:hypothetical protein